MGAFGAVWVVLRVRGCGWWAVSAYKPLDSLCFGAEEGMWAVGAVGVLEERKACGRWVWWGCCGVGGDYKPLDFLCFGAEEGMWAVGSAECGGGERGGA